MTYKNGQSKVKKEVRRMFWYYIDLFNKKNKLSAVIEAPKLPYYKHGLKEEKSLMKNTQLINFVDLDHKNAVKGAFKEVLDNSNIKYGSIYADYMCHLDGNKNVHPLDDFDSIINKSEHNGIVCIELSYMYVQSKFVHQDVGRTISEFQRIANIQDRNAELLRFWLYKPMYVFIFKIS